MFDLRCGLWYSKLRVNFLNTVTNNDSSILWSWWWICVSKWITWNCKSVYREKLLYKNSAAQSLHCMDNIYNYFSPAKDLSNTVTYLAGKSIWGQFPIRPGVVFAAHQHSKLFSNLAYTVWGPFRVVSECQNHRQSISVYQQKWIQSALHWTGYIWTWITNYWTIPLPHSKHQLPLFSE